MSIYLHEGGLNFNMYTQPDALNVNSENLYFEKVEKLQNTMKIKHEMDSNY